MNIKNNENTSNLLENKKLIGIRKIIEEQIKTSHKRVKRYQIY